MVDAIDTPSMQCPRADFVAKATADQAVDEVVRLLSVRDAGEAAVLALEEHARMQHDDHEKASLALGEPESLEVGGGAFGTRSRKPQTSLIESPEELLGRPRIGGPSAAASASAGSNGEPDAVATESGPGYSGRVRATVVRSDDLDVFVADVAVLILVFDPGVGELDAAVEEREVVLTCPGLDLFRPAVRPAVAVGTSPVPLLQELKSRFNS